MPKKKSRAANLCNGRQFPKCDCAQADPFQQLRPARPSQPRKSANFFVGVMAQRKVWGNIKIRKRDQSCQRHAATAQAWRPPWFPA